MWMESFRWAARAYVLTALTPAAAGGRGGQRVDGQWAAGGDVQRDGGGLHHHPLRPLVPGLHQLRTGLAALLQGGAARLQRSVLHRVLPDRLPKATHNEYICQKREKQRYIAVGTCS